jgi:hypothetical protein
MEKMWADPDQRLALDPPQLVECKWKKMWADTDQRPALDTPHGMSVRPTLGTESNMHTFF